MTHTLLGALAVTTNALHAVPLPMCGGDEPSMQCVAWGAALAALYVRKAKASDLGVCPCTVVPYPSALRQALRGASVGSETRGEDGTYVFISP